jgi:hypothetical protein
VINDLYEDWQGDVRFRVIRGDRVIYETVSPCKVAALGRETLFFTTRLPADVALYQFEATLLRHHDKPVKSVREINLVRALTVSDPGLAKGKSARASSSLQKVFAPEKAFDGSKFTRWCSQFSDPQWIAVDLGEPKNVSRLKLLWENAWARAYEIQVSGDGESWKTVYTTDRGVGGIEEVRFNPVSARWVRLYGTKRGTEFGYSLWEMKVFE